MNKFKNSINMNNIHLIFPTKKFLNKLRNIYELKYGHISNDKFSNEIGITKGIFDRYMYRDSPIFNVLKGSALEKIVRNIFDKISTGICWIDEEMFFFFLLTEIIDDNNSKVKSSLKFFYILTLGARLFNKLIRNFKDSLERKRNPFSELNESREKLIEEVISEEILQELINANQKNALIEKLSATEYTLDKLIDDWNLKRNWNVK